MQGKERSQDARVPESVMRRPLHPQRGEMDFPASLLEIVYCSGVLYAEYIVSRQGCTGRVFTPVQARGVLPRMDTRTEDENIEKRSCPRQRRALLYDLEFGSCNKARSIKGYIGCGWSGSKQRRAEHSLNSVIGQGAYSATQEL